MKRPPIAISERQRSENLRITQDALLLLQTVTGNSLSERNLTSLLKILLRYRQKLALYGNMTLYGAFLKMKGCVIEWEKTLEVKN